MEEIRRSPVEGKVVYPISYKVFYMPGGCFGFLNHQQYTLSETNIEPENGWLEDEFSLKRVASWQMLCSFQGVYLYRVV